MKLLAKTAGVGIWLALLGNSPAQFDNIYVSDSAGGTIDRFDSSGKKTIFASGLNSPTGLAFDSSGNLYVAIAGNGTVEKFDVNGNASLFATGLTQLGGLAFDNRGNLFVADKTGSGARNNGTIEKIDSSGNRSVLASSLSLDVPYLACDAGGNLYASALNSILKFNAQGTETIVLGSLNSIYGIAFDTDLKLWASLQGSGSIDPVGGGGGVTSGTPQDFFPSGIGFDGKNDLFACVGGTTIEEYNPARDGSLFAWGLGSAQYLAIERAPEPASFAVFGLGAVIATMVLWRRRRPQILDRSTPHGETPHGNAGHSGLLVGR